ncbi:MAG: hypothetical protein JXA44_02705 [Methanospirillaceae archaeon]|nr:hypothetical protein [Methanospirillaceae archaeon]
MNQNIVKVFIWLIVLCTLIGTVAGYMLPETQTMSEIPSASSSGIGSIPSTSSGSSGIGYLPPTTSSGMQSVQFYPGGYDCYYNHNCGTCVECAQPSVSCTPVCTQQCTPRPPCCEQVCTQQCTPVCQQVCTEQPAICTPVCQQVCTEQPAICTPVCTQQCTQTQTTGYGSCIYGGCTNVGWGGGYCTDCCDYCSQYTSWNRNYMFMANETEIEDVTGKWETDIFGSLYIKLTGDDILRGMYEVDGYKGYMQGDFNGNTTPNVVGFWWQEPTFMLFNNAGGFSMTFDFEGATMEGIYAYGDGTWTPFTGSKVNSQLSEEMEDALYDMPEYPGEISDIEEQKIIDAPNPIDTNPLSAE